MGVLAKMDLLSGASGNDVQELKSIVYSCLINVCTGIADALATAPALGSADPGGSGCVCTTRQAQASFPDNTAVNVICTYTWNFGKLVTGGSLQTIQSSFDKDGNPVKVTYDDGGTDDDHVHSYTAIYSRRIPLGTYTATRYETTDAMDQYGDYLGETNSDTFLGCDAGLLMLVGADGEQVAPGVFNNRYTWEYNPEGYNPLISYFNLAGKIPSDVPGPGVPPPFAPSNGNGWVVPDAYDGVDFSTDFDWVESLQGGDDMMVRALAQPHVALAAANAVALASKVASVKASNIELNNQLAAATARAAARIAQRKTRPVKKQ